MLDTNKQRPGPQNIGRGNNEGGWTAGSYYIVKWKHWHSMMGFVHLLEHSDSAVNTSQPSGARAPPLLCMAAQQRSSGRRLHAVVVAKICALPCFSGWTGACWWGLMFSGPSSSFPWSPPVRNNTRFFQRVTAVDYCANEKFLFITFMCSVQISQNFQNFNVQIGGQSKTS